VKTAFQFYEQLRANTSAWYEGRLSVEKFRAAQSAVWDEIVLAGLVEDVQRLFRAEISGEEVSP